VESVLRWLECVCRGCKKFHTVFIDVFKSNRHPCEKKPTFNAYSTHTHKPPL
jgi:hypothetical protein